MMPMDRHEVMRGVHQIIDSIRRHTDQPAPLHGSNMPGPFIYYGLVAA